MIINFVYIVVMILFILGLKLLSYLGMVCCGNFVFVIGMFIVVVVILIDQQIISYYWILFGFLLGGVYGVWKVKKVEMM